MRTSQENMWLEGSQKLKLADFQPHTLEPQILDSEEAVGRAMLAELEETAHHKEGYINIAILGGRGGQALHRLLGERSIQGDPGGLIARLNVLPRTPWPQCRWTALFHLCAILSGYSDQPFLKQCIVLSRCGPIIPTC